MCCVFARKTGLQCMNLLFFRIFCPVCFWIPIILWEKAGFSCLCLLVVWTHTPKVQTRQPPCPTPHSATITGTNRHGWYSTEVSLRCTSPCCLSSLKFSISNQFSKVGLCILNGKLWDCFLIDNKKDFQCKCTQDLSFWTCLYFSYVFV